MKYHGILILVDWMIIDGKKLFYELGGAPSIWCSISHPSGPLHLQPSRPVGRAQAGDVERQLHLAGTWVPGYLTPGTWPGDGGQSPGGPAGGGLLRHPRAPGALQVQGGHRPTPVWQQGFSIF